MPGTRESCDAISDEEMEQLREEQRKRHEELYGIPASGLPGEENDDDDDLGEPNLQLDTGDTSADGAGPAMSDDLGATDGGDDRRRDDRQHARRQAATTGRRTTGDDRRDRRRQETARGVRVRIIDSNTDGDDATRRGAGGVFNRYRIIDYRTPRCTSPPYAINLPVGRFCGRAEV